MATPLPVPSPLQDILSTVAFEDINHTDRVGYSWLSKEWRDGEEKIKAAIPIGTKFSDKITCD